MKQDLSSSEQCNPISPALQETLHWYQDHLKQWYCSVAGQDPTKQSSLKMAIQQEEGPPGTSSSCCFKSSSRDIASVSTKRPNYTEMEELI